MTTETYTHEQINNWSDHSFFGKERNLCDQLDSNIIDWAMERDDAGADMTEVAFDLYSLLMMHRGVLEGATERADRSPSYISRLRDELREDANDESGVGFRYRLEQRIYKRRELLGLIRN